MNSSTVNDVTRGSNSFSDFGSLKAWSRRRRGREIRVVSLARCHLKTSEVSAVAQIGSTETRTPRLSYFQGYPRGSVSVNLWTVIDWSFATAIYGVWSAGFSLRKPKLWQPKGCTPAICQSSVIDGRHRP